MERHQSAITVAYDFTDYCSQSQTLPYVAVDIAKPLSSGLSLFKPCICCVISKEEQIHYTVLAGF
ncbi:hypothetical protein V8B97DRAFT_1952423 [Scleroderma yunnanense]